MGLIVNLVLQTIVWFGFMGAMIFLAAGTIRYPGGWLYFAITVAMSIAFGGHLLRVDPGLLSERLKGPMQRAQPLADKLMLAPILLIMFGGMAFMAADAARCRWSAAAPAAQGAGCALLLASMLFMY